MTAGDAKGWAYQLTIDSLSRKATALKAADVSPRATAGDVKKCQAQLTRLAESLEKKRASFVKRGAPCSKS